jgi:hypothetical protein
MQQPGGVTVHASDSDSDDPQQQQRQRHTERPHPRHGNVDHLIVDSSCTESEAGLSQESAGSAAAQRWAAAPVTAKLAAECEAQVLAALAAAAAAGQAPAWVQAAKAVLGEPALGLLGSAGRAGSALQQVSPLSLMHDCRGVDGTGEALRHLVLHGVLVQSPVLVADSERNAAATAWCRIFHRWPALHYSDMCSRGPMPTPPADVYINGFPCQPFSTRRGNKSATFEEDNAKPFFAMVKEVQSGKHRAVLLENVQGLLTKSYEGEPCIKFVLQQLERASAGRYYIDVSSNVSPESFGEACHRPRVFLRLLLKTECLVPSQECYTSALHAADLAIRTAALRLSGTPNALESLRARRVLEPSKGPRACQEPAPGFCPCCLPLLPGQPVAACTWHRCACPSCRRSSDAGSESGCQWQARHRDAWSKLLPGVTAVPVSDSMGPEDDDVLMDRPTQSYFEEAYKRGLPAGHFATTPRVRNLIELVAQELRSNGYDPFECDASLDVSQSYGRHALRVDGLLPTIATSSQIWVMRRGCVLGPESLFHIMGFPIDAYKATGRLSLFSQAELKRFVGNTMHPGAVGPMLVSLLSLMRALPSPAAD